MSREVLGAKVVGFCPMGCGETLFTGSGGHVTCSYIECPNPCAVDELLTERETEHIVVFGPEGFDIKHPLRERIGGELSKCGLHQFCTNLDGPPVKTGRYRAVKRARAERGWIFTPLGEPHYLRCPACGFDHTDDDGDPGVWGGRLLEMFGERTKLLRRKEIVPEQAAAREVEELPGEGQRLDWEQARHDAREAFSANVHHPDAVAEFGDPQMAYTPEECFHQGFTEAAMLFGVVRDTEREHGPAPCPCGEPSPPGYPPCTFEKPCSYAQGMPRERWEHEPADDAKHIVIGDYACQPVGTTLEQAARPREAGV